MVLIVLTLLAIHFTPINAQFSGNLNIYALTDSFIHNFVQNDNNFLGIS